MQEFHQQFIQLAHQQLYPAVVDESQLFPLKAYMDHFVAENFKLTERMEKLNRGLSWSFVELYPHPQFHINLLMIPKKNEIPLHNHPKMHVLLKVLWGKMHIQAFDWAQEYPYEGLVRETQNGIYDGASPTLLIRPDTRNIHRIRAIEDCAFLDVVTPPYSEKERPCEYYQEVRVRQKNGESLIELRVS